jgi:hypothetical protein
VVYVNEYTETPSEAFKFGTCVIEFGLILRDSEYKKNSGFSSIFARLNSLTATDEYKDELYDLVLIASNLMDE